MGLKDNASLALIPAAYKTSKIYSAIPTDGDGDFTFTRSGNATRVNKAGLVETMGTNIGRLNYDLTNGTPASCPSLLLEPSRTNQITKSKDFEGWQDLGGSETITNNNATAPDGTNTAATIEKTGSDTTTLRFFTSYSNFSTIRSASIYIKKLSGSPTVSFGITDTQDSITPTNEWVRYTKDNVTPTDFGAPIFVDIEVSGVSGDKIAVWGAQLEEGTYSTSIIETSGSEITRTLDKCLNAGDANLFNDTEGTLFVDLENFSGNTRELTLGDGTINNRVTVIFYGASAVIRFYVANGGVAQADSVFSISFTYDQRNKIAFRYKQNDFKAYINGTQVFSDTSGNTPVGLSRFDFANSNATTNFIEGEIYQTMVFNTALSDSELQTLTS